MSEEELAQYMGTLGKRIAAGSLNDRLFLGVAIQIAQAEMQRRATYKLRDAVAAFETSSRAASAELHQAITDFKDASDSAANRLQGATWVLVVLTIALLGATIALIVSA